MICAKCKAIISEEEEIELYKHRGPISIMIRDTSPLETIVFSNIANLCKDCVKSLCDWWNLK